MDVENKAVEYEDESYVAGVRDLADIIERDQTANWKAVAGVLRDCAALIEGHARHRSTAHATGFAEGVERAAAVAEAWKSSLRPGTEARLLGHQEAARNIAQAIRAKLHHRQVHFVRCPTCGGEFDEAEWEASRECPECESPKSQALKPSTDPAKEGGDE